MGGFEMKKDTLKNVITFIKLFLICKKIKMKIKIPICYGTHSFRNKWGSFQSWHISFGESSWIDQKATVCYTHGTHNNTIK